MSPSAVWSFVLGTIFGFFLHLLSDSTEAIDGYFSFQADDSDHELKDESGIFQNNEVSIEEVPLHWHNSSKSNVESWNSTRVLCWIMTHPRNHQKKALHVKNTWGKRCNKLIFMSSEADSRLPSVALPNVEEGRNWLWEKTKQALQLIRREYFDDAEWFFKADDDTYAIIEHLKYFLSSYDSDEPHYFGLNFKHENYVYMSGGAGYVLSKEALKQIVDVGFGDQNMCHYGHDGAEDLNLGKCAQNLGISAGDSRDEGGAYRFLAFTPKAHLIPGRISKKNWWWRYILYPYEEGMSCCSDTAISFHYIKPDQMYEMEFMIYHLNPGKVTLEF